MDNIKFTLPAKAEYLLAVRLTASAIGTRRELSIDAIESFKSAVSEGCLIVMGSSGCTKLNIEFFIDTNKLYVEIMGIDVSDDRPEVTELEISKFMLEAMAVNVKFQQDDNSNIYGVTFTAAEE